MDKKAKAVLGILVGGAVITGIALATRKAEAAPPPEPASLAGIVTNASTGQPIFGASVTLGTLNTSTDSSGRYNFNNITPGSYAMTFEKAGYQTATF